MMLDGLTWVATDGWENQTSDIPYATRSAVLELFGKKLRCYRLSNGMAVFHADDFAAFFAALSPEEKEEAEG